MIKIKMLMLMLGMLLVGPAQSAGIKIWPLKISLWPEQTSDSVRLTNEGSEPVNVQISAKTWDMDETGNFVETDTGDFVFFPRLLTLAPHEEKPVRVGYQGNFPPLEKSYRLYIEELPPVLPPEKQRESFGVTYKLKLSLPLFVMPNKTPPAAEVVIDGTQKGERKLVVRSEKGLPEKKEKVEPVLKVGVRVPGTHHVQLSKVAVELFDAAGKSLIAGENDLRLLRILPKRRVFVDIPLNTQVCNKAKSLLVKVHAEGLDKPYEQRVPFADGGSCQMTR